MRIVKLAVAMCFYTSAMAETGSPDEGPWWVGHLITVGAAFIGAVMIVCQIGWQRKNEIHIQRENQKIGFRLQIYQEFATQLQNGMSALGKVGMYAFFVPTNISVAKSNSREGQIEPVADRAKLFMELNFKACSEIAETIILVDKYLLVDPAMDLFRMALSSAAHDLQESFGPLFSFMNEKFPIDLHPADGGGIKNIKEFSSEEIDRAQLLAMDYYDKTSDAQNFLMDIQTELQLVFLGELFQNQPIRRVPANPTVRVLSLEPAAAKSLRQHFLKNTAWGRSTVTTSMEVHRHFNG